MYSITLAGETLCVITAAGQTGELYRNSSTITWDNLIKEMFASVGLSLTSIDNMFSESREETGSLNSKVPTRSPSEMTSEFHRQQLTSAANADKIDKRIIPSLEKNLSWNNLKQHQACIRTSGESITLSLWEWCNEVIIKGATTAYYGPKIFEINPNLLQAMMTWEATNWKLFYKLPGFMARDMTSAKNEFIETLYKYFDTPREERTDVLYFVKAMEDELRAAGLSNREAAGIHMLHLWASV